MYEICCMHIDTFAYKYNVLEAKRLLVVSHSN